MPARNEIGGNGARANLARRAAIRYLRLWALWSGVPWSDQLDQQISAAVGQVINRAQRKETLRRAYSHVLGSAE